MAFVSMVMVSMALVSMATVSMVTVSMATVSMVTVSMATVYIAVVSVSRFMMELGVRIHFFYSSPLVDKSLSPMVKLFSLSDDDVKLIKVSIIQMFPLFVWD